MTDVLKVGPHRHINGDSTKAEFYEKVMEGKKAKMLYADPPYCLLVRRNKKTGTLRDPKNAKINHEAVKRYENVREYRRFTEDWMGQATKHIADDGVLCIWINFLGKEPIKTAAKKLGFEHFYGEFTWAKLTKEGSGNEVIARIYEVCLIFSKVPLVQPSLNELPIPWTVLTKYDEEGEAGRWENHPNHKPFSSLEPLIRAYTKVGDRILDPFTGSGSTPAAAIQLGREISGIELREHWAQTSQNRIQVLHEENS